MNKVKLVGFENSVFSNEQLDFVAASATALQAWVERYKISPESVEIEEAQQHEDENPGTVFTLAFEPASLDKCSARYPLVPDFWLDEEEYFISEIKIDDSAANLGWAYTILDLHCTVCQGPFSDNKDCLNCLDGELSVDFFWDESWNVTAEYSDPRSS